jgi:hypothetical protein
VCAVLHRVRFECSYIGACILADYGHSCATPLVFFPAIINCGNYGSVEKIEFCNLNQGILQIAPGI